MLNTNKRAAKCLHYYQTDIEFKKIIDDTQITYYEIIEYIGKNYKDLHIVYSEIRAFYYGIENYNDRFGRFESEPIRVFFQAGLKVKS